MNDPRILLHPKKKNIRYHKISFLYKYLLCITKCQVCYRCLMFKYIKHASRIHYGDRTISVEQVGDSLLMV